MHNKRLRELDAIVPLNNITKNIFWKSHEEKIVKTQNWKISFVIVENMT